MGALHPGHVALIRTAAAAAGDNDAVVLSIFVNPTQFAPGEDFATYPRTFEADLDLCRTEGVAVVFAPTVTEVYPEGEPTVTVDPGPLGTELEGRSRPTHFRGVLTVVAKLFGLVRPDRAYFGEKDYQQLTLIRRMVADLSMAVEVVGVPTVREPSGLAMSSRNLYLDEAARTAATALSTALRAGAAAAAEGPGAAESAALTVLAGEPAVALDYLAVAGPSLGPAPGSGEGRILVAAHVGGTRLIDNLRVVFGKR
jgi:pantoate--beta-alanine ligase